MEFCLRVRIQSLLIELAEGGQINFLCLSINALHSTLNSDIQSRLQEILHRTPVEGTPTLKFYCQGREVDEHVGYAIESVLRKKIDGILEEMNACRKNHSVERKSRYRNRNVPKC